MFKMFFSVLLCCFTAMSMTPEAKGVSTLLNLTGIKDLSDVKFSDDGKSLLITSADGYKLVDIKSQKVIYENPWKFGDEVKLIGRFDSRGGEIITDSQITGSKTDLTSVLIWEAKTGKIKNRYDLKVSLSDVKSSHCRNFLVGKEDGVNLLWKIDRTTEKHSPLVHDDKVRRFWFDDTGKYIFSIADDGHLYKWNISDNTLVFKFKAHEGIRPKYYEPFHVATHRLNYGESLYDAKIATTGCIGSNSSVDQFELKIFKDTGELLKSFGRKKGLFGGPLVFNAMQDSLLVADINGFFIWDVDEEKIKSTMYSPQVMNAKYSLGKDLLLVSFADRRVVLYDRDLNIQAIFRNGKALDLSTLARAKFTKPGHCPAEEREKLDSTGLAFGLSEDEHAKRFPFVDDPSFAPMVMDFDFDSSNSSIFVWLSDGSVTVWKIN